MLDDFILEQRTDIYRWLSQPVRIKRKNNSPRYAAGKRTNCYGRLLIGRVTLIKYTFRVQFVAQQPLASFYEQRMNARRNSVNVSRLVQGF